MKPEEFILRLGVALHRYGTPTHRLEMALARLSTELGVDGQFFVTPTAIFAASNEAAMRAIPHDDLQGATTIDILTATALSSLERFGESEELFLEILRHKPWLVGPLVDLGHTYAKRFETPRAWRCWEHAHRLAPEHRMIRRFSEQRARLREKYAAWLQGD